MDEAEVKESREPRAESGQPGLSPEFVDLVKNAILAIREFIEQITEAIFSLIDLITVSLYRELKRQRHFRRYKRIYAHGGRKGRK